MIVDSYTIRASTPKGCHVFGVNHAIPSGLGWMFA